MKPLRDIPNQSGFRLFLIRPNETTLLCFVAQTQEGRFALFSMRTKERVTDAEPLSNFIGWKEIPKSMAELHLESLPVLSDMKRHSWQLFTKEQLAWQKKPIPKKDDAEIIANLGTLERITKTPAKSTDGKSPLYCWELWTKSA